MLHVPTAPWAHLVFDLIAWSSGIAVSVVLYSPYLPSDD